MVSAPKVVWANIAQQQLKEIIAYIRNDSPKNSVTVRKKILKATKAISDAPFRHSPDVLRLDGDNQYRAFEIYRYRITYLIEPEIISVIRIRGTWQEPLLH